MSLATQEAPAATGELADLIGRMTRLYEDLELRSVREWKSQDATRRAIGFLPVYVPREVIHAAGALPVGIMGGGDQIEIVRGDSYFQSYICHLPRSVIELAVSGRLNALDGFVFPSICDVIRNLSGMFKVLLADKWVHYLDLPQNFDRASGGRFYRHEMATIANGVSALTGMEITDDRLRASIRLYNENRRALADLQALRVQSPWLVPATEYYLLLRASYMLPPEAHTAMVREYMRLSRTAQRSTQDNIRVMVRGAFCEQPPLGLLRTLERAGCYLVDDDFVLGARFIPDPLPEEGDPWQALIDGFLYKSLPTASKYDVNATKEAEIVQRARDVRADGVLLIAPSFCDPALLDQPMLARALDKAGIPYTSFKYAEDTGQFQVIREQAGTFADAIKLWGTK